jgi:FlgD Ig-like domain
VATNTTRLSTVAFAALVLATIAAFLVIQHLKVKTPLILGRPAPVPAAINPLHGVPCFGRNSASTTISFYLDRTDDVDVYVVDANGDSVRTVASGRHMPKDVRNPYGVFHWDGRLADGRVAPDGTYYFRVALRHQGRTIDLTNVPVKVKTTAPRPVVLSVSPPVIPSGSGNRDVTIRFGGNETRAATVLLYRADRPGGPRLVKTFLAAGNGQPAVWNGTINGRPAPAGTYLVGLEVTDAACNTGRAPTNHVVTVR